MTPKTIDPPAYEEPAVPVEGSEPKAAASAVMNNGSKKPSTNTAKNSVAKNSVAKNSTAINAGSTMVGDAPASPTVVAPAESNAMVKIVGDGVSGREVFKMNGTALVVKKGLTDAQFENLGTEIAQVGSCYRFWLGDYILAMVERLKATDSKITITKACEYVSGRIAPQYDATSLQNIATTMATVKPEQRVEGLSFTHHEYASKVPMDPAERKKMLTKAKTEGWSTRLFNQKLRERITGKPAPGNNVHVDGVDDDEPQTQPTHPSVVKISFEASQAATSATEDFNTNYHKNLTVDRFVSMILESLDNIIVLSDEGMDALKALKNASAKGADMTLAEAASRLFVKTAKAASPPEPASTSDVPTSGPPPVA